MSWVNTGATLFLPYTFCYCVKCMKGEYDQSWNTVYAVLRWSAVILLSEAVLRVPKNEPEPEEVLAQLSWCRRGTLWLLQLRVILGTTSLKSQGSRLLLCQSQMTMVQNFTKHWHLKRPLSKRKYYRHDLQRQENVCSGCSGDTLHIWNMKWEEQEKAKEKRQNCI